MANVESRVSCEVRGLRKLWRSSVSMGTGPTRPIQLGVDISFVYAGLKGLGVK